MLPNVGWSEILVIMVLALVIFGPNRLPDIARQVGRALGELRRVSGQFQQELRSGLAIDEDPNFPYRKGPPGPAAAAPAEAPRAEAPQAEGPQAEAPQAEGPQAEVPAPEPPLPDAPAPQAPQVPERESGPSSPS